MLGQAARVDRLCVRNFPQQIRSKADVPQQIRSKAENLFVWASMTCFLSTMARGSLTALYRFLKCLLLGHRAVHLYVLADGQGLVSLGHCLAQVRG